MSIGKRSAKQHITNRFLEDRGKYHFLYNEILPVVVVVLIEKGKNE